MGPTPKPVLTRWLEHVAFGDTDDCWEWLGFRDPNGYGRLAVKTDRGWRSMSAFDGSLSIYGVRSLRASS